MSDNEIIIMAYVYLITSSVLTVVCLVGNTWTCYIFTREKFRKVSMFFYLAISNIVNLLMMLTVWPVSLARNGFKYDTLAFSCKFFTYITYFLSDLGPCILLMSSLDRLASVKYSRKFQFRNKFKYQLLIVLVLTALIAILNFPLLIYCESIKVTLQNMTFTICFFTIIKYNNAVEYYLWIKTFMVSLFIPFVLMLISTILIAHHLIKSKKQINSSRTKFKKEMRYVRIVVSVDLFYLLTNCPSLILALVQVATNFNFASIIYLKFLNILLEVYLSADFFLYYWCNKLFRDYVKNIFNCNKKKKLTVSAVHKNRDKRS